MEGGGYRADVHSSSAMGTAVTHTISPGVGYTEPSVTMPSAECGLLLDSDEGPVTPTNTYGAQRELGLAPGQEICSNVLQFAKEFISDSIWTVSDGKGCTGAPQALPMSMADEPGTAASSNPSATPLAPLPFEGLFSVELDALTDC